MKIIQLHLKEVVTSLFSKKSVIFCKWSFNQMIIYYLLECCLIQKIFTDIRTTLLWEMEVHVSFQKENFYWQQTVAKANR